MSKLSDALSAALSHEFRARAADLHQWADPLSDDRFWQKPFSHAGSGYVRDRDLEFTESRRPSKGEVLRKFDEAIALVLTTLDRQSDSNWTLPYSAERQPDATNRIAAFLRCVVHLDHHVGQIIYLSRELQKN